MICTHIYIHPGFEFTAKWTALHPPTKVTVVNHEFTEQPQCQLGSTGLWSYLHPTKQN